MNVLVNRRRTVLVFSGLDPSGGAGMTADISAILATGAHPLSIITTLTVQDNNRVYDSQPVSSQLIREQAEALIKNTPIDAVKIGIMGNIENAQVIVNLLRQLRISQPSLPIVFDPVLMSGHGDSLATDAVENIWPEFFAMTTVLTPNLPEAKYLSPKSLTLKKQAEFFIKQGVSYVLIKGGHSEALGDVINIGFDAIGNQQEWAWPRLEREFHGSGCTLAAAIAGYLARGFPVNQAVDHAQDYCQTTLTQAYQITKGQKIPKR